MKTKTVRQTEIFTKWFEKLRDAKARLRIQVQIDRAEIGNYGNYKSVGEGVLELRIDHGPGYRVYFVERNSELIMLLAGGTKASQSKDIKLAKELAKLV